MSCADSSSAPGRDNSSTGSDSTDSSSTDPAQPTAAAPPPSGQEPSLASPESPSPPRRHSHRHHHHHHHSKTKRTVTARPAADTPVGQQTKPAATATTGLSPEALAAAAARPGSIMHESARQSYTLASVKVGMSESMLRELARKGKTETVAFHRGNTAGRVVQCVPYPETAHLTENMLFDPTTDLPSLALLRTHFTKEVCGDLHGQFYDMMTVFDLTGPLDKTDTKYLFLGDYVDRGFFSTEIVLYLCAVLLNYPDRLYLLRGNHETRLMCEYMTFLAEVRHKYGMGLYNDFHAFFDTLQVAAVVHGTPNGDCLCVHGGIGPELKTLADIEELDRFCEVHKKTPFWDIVWADPLPERGRDGAEHFASEEDWAAATFLPNEFRHSSYLYGLAAVERFLEANNLCTIIRGHQVQQQGYCEHFTLPSRCVAIAPVLTVFSAPNYCDQYHNCAAFLRVHSGGFVVQQFNEAAHPHMLPGFVDAFTWSLPMLLEGIVCVLQQLVMDTSRDADADTEEEKAADKALEEKTHSLFQRVARVRTQQAAFRAVHNESYHKNMSLFERILREDQENEATPAQFASAMSGSGPKLTASKKSSSFKL